ncbi:MAG TPA: hypothetical protein VNM67_05740 [Thermoanaerobaculia bacterium]|nr:hypothetical protein [Thermoanaerobaculia bacterium]
MGNPPAPSIRLGYLLVGATFLVEVSWLVLTTLAAGHRPVSPDTEQLLLIVAAVAMAVVLTGGNLYLTHAALTAPRWRIALGIALVLVLGASGGLVAPAIAGGFVSATGLRPAWALLAALAHLLTAAGCILAEVAKSRPRSLGNVLCQGCGRAFASKQARGGHQRSCPARLPAL